MLIGNGKVKVFYYTGACDMRRQMNRLSTMVREELGQNPEDGHLYVFRNRRGDMLRVLFFDQRGCCLLSKRLHEGTFRVLVVAEGHASAELSQEQFALLLSTGSIGKPISKKA